MRYLLCCFVLLIFGGVARAQLAYPTDYFSPPLEVPIVLAGTFGELRSNHFHSGIDIKTQQREGLKVVAIGEGYISRIKVQHYGFGKALYIQHPNGYTSVYAHLKKFSPEIEALIKKDQYDKKSYETDIYLNPSDLRVQEGEVIAYSGNTGSSAGPHLHFEIRDREQKPINPLFFGYEVEDTESPRVRGVHAYTLDDSSQVQGRNGSMELRLGSRKNDTLYAEKIYASGTIGFGIDTYDRQDLAYNKNGAYSISLAVNGKPRFSYNFTTFSFAETSYINTLIDYRKYAFRNERIQKCFLEPWNKLSIYKENINDGKIDIENGLTYMVSLRVADFHDNVSTIIIPVEGRNADIAHKEEQVRTPYFVKADRDNIFDIGDARVYFPSNSLYFDTFLDLKQNGDQYTIHDSSVPIKNSYTLSITANDIPGDDPDKYFIAGVDNHGRLSYNRTYRKEKIYTTRTKAQGTFTLAKDTVSPSVRPMNFRDEQYLSNFRYLKLRIEDDLSGINTYNAWINGEWVLMEYEYKDQSITFNFDDLKTEEKKCELKVEVTDNVGNSTIFNSTFYLK
ncbi:M23 family metallopeptidase [Robertkochia aurantiaca]|uniref:M23 family metallopeptidase n=1 Tax=Robertkochia aurantiaca TaxID=2873700 RepID=UPI001CCC175B|nr:M23 family metallopeptidase [Robertkochia sp. 3YJGBD-33]